MHIKSKWKEEKRKNKKNVKKFEHINVKRITNKWYVKQCGEICIEQCVN